jgi:ubiquitin-protein ligase
MTAMRQRRIAGDIRTIMKSDMQSKEYDFYYTEDTSKFVAVIYGAEDSCYEGCMFYFNITLDDKYPINPPMFKFVTPINKRFHPNLYAEGKVCLTVLNTWHDSKIAGWNSATTLESIFVIIRSMMDDNPVAQEPGQYSVSKTAQNAINYQIAAKYYSLLNTFSLLENTICIPEELFEKMKNKFKQNLAMYDKMIAFLMPFNNQQIKYFHGDVMINMCCLIDKYDKNVIILHIIKNVTG